MNILSKAIASAFLAVTLAGCNYEILDFHYSFDKAYVKMPDGSSKILAVKSWKDYEGEQLQIIDKDGHVWLVNSVNTILYRD